MSSQNRAAVEPAAVGFLSSEPALPQPAHLAAVVPSTPVAPLVAEPPSILPVSPSSEPAAAALEDEDWRRKDSGVDIADEHCTKVFATPTGKMVRVLHHVRPPPCHEALTYHASLKRARTLDSLHPHLSHSHIIDVHDLHHHLHGRKVPFMRRRSVKWTLTIIMFLLLVAIAAFVGIVLKSRS
ncbi:hypothetical protein HDU88_003292 [Geranomyces variabilis]|nr:hypothetical protein HDU88_003292 [Geranomyces variabilis]